jgi:hypothetical protein
MTRPEQRRRARVRLGSELLVRIAGRLVRAECINVSMSGAMLDIELELEGSASSVLLGDQGQLELVHRCGGDRLAVGASFTVMRIDQAAANPGFVQVGVHFTDIDTASSLHLFELIRWQGG